MARRRIERIDGIGRKAEDERPEYVNAFRAEGLQPCNERLAGVIEVLVDGLQAFGGDGLVGTMTFSSAGDALRSSMSASLKSDL